MLVRDEDRVDGRQVGVWTTYYPTGAVRSRATLGDGQIEGVLERVRPTKGTLKEMMDQLERWLLIEALREHGNNKTAAAKNLGITREGLHKKLRAFGL